MRVVSLLPSATESLLAITGAEALSPDAPVQLVGRSHECDFPPALAASNVPVLTAARTAFKSSAQIDREVRAQLESGQSLYTLDIDLLNALKPDLIITQDLCAVCSIDLATVRAAAAAMSPRPAVLSLNPETFEGVLDDVLSIGAAIDQERRATEVLVALRERVYRAEEYVNPYTAKPVVAFLEWTDPLFIGGHWTPQLIERAGGDHPLNPTRPIESAGAAAGPIGQTLRRAGKSVVITPEALAAAAPEFLIISPCGLTLDQAVQEAALLARHAWFQALPAARNNRVAIVDGNQMFNRPGPRLVDAFEFLVGLINDRSDVIPRDFPWTRPPV